MKKKHSSDLYASISVSSVDSNSSDFETLSLRIPHRTAATVRALNIGFQQPLLTLFTDRISEHLAESLLGSVENDLIILEETENDIQPESALHLLFNSGAITNDNKFLRSNKITFQKEGN